MCRLVLACTTNANIDYISLFSFTNTDPPQGFVSERC